MPQTCRSPDVNPPGQNNSISSSPRLHLHTHPSPPFAARGSTLHQSSIFGFRTSGQNASHSVVTWQPCKVCDINNALYFTAIGTFCRQKGNSPPSRPPFPSPQHQKNMSNRGGILFFLCSTLGETAGARSAAGQGLVRGKKREVCGAPAVYISSGHLLADRRVACALAAACPFAG